MKKVFITLCTIVLCLMIGGFVLNTLAPNIMDQGIMAVEDSIFNATGFSFDLDGNGRAGAASQGTYNASTNGNAADDNSAGVEGYFN